MWLFNNEEVRFPPPGYYGFCYRIINLIDSRIYLGRKTFWFRKGNRVVESDWKVYFGSSLELKNDLILYGKENFRREIISFHQNKSDLNYSEIKLIFQSNALESGDFYNSNIGGRYFKSKLLNLSSRSLFENK